MMWPIAFQLLLPVTNALHLDQWTTASFDLPPEGSAKKENKLDCFELKHIFCFKLHCAGIVYLLCTALWWQIIRRGGLLLPP